MTRIILLLSILIASVSCNSSNNRSKLLEEREQNGNKVEQYADVDGFIDVDIHEISKRLTDPATKSGNMNLDEDELAQVKAAIYRFYSHVKVENGYYVCTIKDAKEINVSQKTFDGLLEGINILNEGIDKARQDGLPVELREPSEEYLNSLLQ